MTRSMPNKLAAKAKNHAKRVLKAYNVQEIAATPKAAGEETTRQNLFEHYVLMFAEELQRHGLDSVVADLASYGETVEVQDAAPDPANPSLPTAWKLADLIIGQQPPASPILRADPLYFGDARQIADVEPLLATALDPTDDEDSAEEDGDNDGHGGDDDDDSDDSDSGHGGNGSDGGHGGGGGDAGHGGHGGHGGDDSHGGDEGQGGDDGHGVHGGGDDNGPPAEGNAGHAGDSTHLGGKAASGNKSLPTGKVTCSTDKGNSCTGINLSVLIEQQLEKPKNVRRDKVRKVSSPLKFLTEDLATTVRSVPTDTRPLLPRLSIPIKGDEHDAFFTSKTKAIQRFFNDIRDVYTLKDPSDDKSKTRWATLYYIIQEYVDYELFCRNEMNLSGTALEFAIERILEDRRRSAQGISQIMREKYPNGGTWPPRDNSVPPSDTPDKFSALAFPLDQYERLRPKSLQDAIRSFELLGDLLSKHLQVKHTRKEHFYLKAIEELVPAEIQVAKDAQKLYHKNSPPCALEGRKASFAAYGIVQMLGTKFTCFYDRLRKEVKTGSMQQDLDELVFQIVKTPAPLTIKTNVTASDILQDANLPNFVMPSVEYAIASAAGSQPIKSVKSKSPIKTLKRKATTNAEAAVRAKRHDSHEVEILPSQEDTREKISSSWSCIITRSKGKPLQVYNEGESGISDCEGKEEEKSFVTSTTGSLTPPPAKLTKSNSTNPSTPPDSASVADKMIQEDLAESYSDPLKLDIPRASGSEAMEIDQMSSASSTCSSNYGPYWGLFLPTIEELDEAPHQFGRRLSVEAKCDRMAEESKGWWKLW